MVEESNEELAFPNTVLTRNNGKIISFLYRKPPHTR